MSTRNMLKSRKAISPILATLLLIVIAVAAIVVTYAWIMMYTGSATGAAGLKINIDTANINSTSKTINIYVRNTSPNRQSLKVDKVYIESLNPPDVTSKTNLTSATTIPYGETILITGSQIDFTAYTQYKVIVIGQPSDIVRAEYFATAQL
jgi:flagellin-like protein